jgi:hypothetical protein
VTSDDLKADRASIESKGSWSGLVFCSNKEQGTQASGPVFCSGFTVSRNGAKFKVADQAIDKLKERVRELTRRTRGTAIGSLVAELRETLLRSLGTMGTGRLPGTAQARRIGARSVEYQQVSPGSMAVFQDTGTGRRATLALFRNLGTAQPCTAAGIHFIEPPDT